jgi:pyruvate dehydrogenase E1 component alpha subunit
VPIVAKFEIEFRRYLDEKGALVGETPGFAADPKVLIPLYRAMVRTRTFDAKAVALQRTGKLGTFASGLGQEATAIGVGSAMRPEDVLLPSYRDFGTQFMRGVSMEEILLYWGGDERGSDFARAREDFPICVPIATQCAHAAGVATAFKLRNEKRVAVCMLGDGATSKGDFYEAVNLAGAWNLPVVFVVSNNQWAISVPRAKQTSALTLAQKAIAGGVAGLQIDGNDILAVRAVMDEALERAREGGGCTVIEALTYRLHDHTTADDATRYRDAAEVKAKWGEEPILRLRNYLAAQGVWTKEAEEELLKACADEVQQAVERYQAVRPPQVSSMFEHLYAKLPDVLLEQKTAAEKAHPLDSPVGHQGESGEI